MRLLITAVITVASVLLPGRASATSALQVEPLPFASGERAAQPSVTVDQREGFVVTWQECDGSDHVLRFAVLDVAGTERRRGEIARGTDWFVNAADFPNLAVLDNGDWVTFYLHKTSPGTYSSAIRLLRSRDAGISWDAPVLLHRDGTDTEHGFVSLVPAGGEMVRAVWLDGRHMSGGHDDVHGDASAEHMTLRSAALGRDGTLIDEYELDNLTCACCQTDAVRIGERTVVAYRDRYADEQRDINLVEFTAGTWSPPRSLHPDGWIIAACPVNGPALAVNGDRIAALWPTMAGGEMRLNVSVGSLDNATRVPLLLASGPSELGRVDLAGWTEGRWLATRGQPGTDAGAAAQPAGGRWRRTIERAHCRQGWRLPTTGNARRRGDARMGRAGRSAGHVARRHRPHFKCNATLTKQSMRRVHHGTGG